ncbi:hypothetical protein BC629DRAFT_1725485 [Irpex lacteus]|nr:hypothetical protein BC629DRAFT_1725485 [Irpex lacteus]
MVPVARMHGCFFYGPKSPEGFIAEFMSINATEANAMPQGVSFPQARRFCETASYDAFKETIEKYGISPAHNLVRPAGGKNGLKDGLKLDRPDAVFEGVKVFSAQSSEQNLCVEGAAEGPRVDSKSCYSDGLVVEFKTESSADPFNTRKKISEVYETVNKSVDPERKNLVVPIAKTSETHVRIQEQLARHAIGTFTRQYRTHLFQLLICGNLARFLLWDHSGAIVSEELNYLDDPSLLVRFIWHYNHMTPEARGLDSTARTASSDERATFQSKVKHFLDRLKHSHSWHPYFNSLIPTSDTTLDEAWPVYRLAVRDSVSQELFHVLIQRPFVHAHNVIGRGTRGYVAYCIETEEVGFLKDTWRVVHDRLCVERQVLHELAAAGNLYKYVPRVICGGDVNITGEAHRTRSNEWTQTQDPCKMAGRVTLREFQHHRLLEEFALPVQVAPNSKVYTEAFLNAVMAMSLAYLKCGVVHRDFSVGNGMIVIRDNQLVGVLCDWDHSGAAILPVDAPHHTFRAGTWQFMSIAMLRDPRKAQDILDDYESVFWAFLYGAVHGYRHTKRVGTFNITTVFDAENRSRNHPSIVTGGLEKKFMLLPLLEGGLEFNSSAMNGLVRGMCLQWSDLYGQQDIIGVTENKKSRLLRPSRLRPEDLSEKYRNDPELLSLLISQSPEPEEDLVEKATAVEEQLDAQPEYASQEPDSPAWSELEAGTSDLGNTPGEQPTGLAADPGRKEQGKTETGVSVVRMDNEEAPLSASTRTPPSSRITASPLPMSLCRKRSPSDHDGREVDDHDEIPESKKSRIEGVQTRK